MQIHALQVPTDDSRSRTSPPGRTAAVGQRHPQARGRRFACAKSGRGGGTTRRKPRAPVPPARGGPASLRCPPRLPGLRAAGPPDVTVPSSSLLNFKSSSLAQPGGGGFLGRRRFRTPGTPALPAPSAPCAPEGCAHLLPGAGPGSPAAPGAGAWAGRGRGGAWAAEGGYARARREVARRLRPREGGGQEQTSEAGNPPQPGAGLSSCRRSAPRRFAPWLLHPGRATPSLPQREN